MALDKIQESHGYISENLLLFDSHSTDSTTIVISVYVYIAQDVHLGNIMETHYLLTVLILFEILLIQGWYLILLIT